MDCKKVTDQWDVQQIGDLMTLNKNRVTYIGDPNDPRVEGGNTAFLSKIVDHGVHRWTFKVNLMFSNWWAVTIGVYKVPDDETALPKNGIFCLGSGRGYGYNVTEGTLTDLESGGAFMDAVQYGPDLFFEGLVEMVLDLDRMELKWIVDGEDNGKAFDVAKGSYLAAVNLSIKRDTVEFVGYKME